MSPANHAVLIPLGARSHLRLILQLTVNLLLLHPSLITTTVITRINHGKLQEEIGLHPKDVMTGVKDRFRVIVLEDELEGDQSAMVENNVLKQKIGPVLQDLFEGKDNGKWGTIPCMIIADIFRAFVRSKVQEMTADLGIPKIPVLQFMPSMAMTMHRFVNTTANNGSAEKMVERYHQNREAGMNEVEAARKAFRFVQNILLEWPDLPPMYDYECTPQAEHRVINAGVCMVHELIWNASRDTDGVICISVPELDGASIESISKTQGVPIIGVGPQFNESVWAAEDEHIGERGGEEDQIMRFLDEKLKRYGPNSCAYVSLGTTAWPTLRPDIIDMIVETLMAANIPFIFATACPDGKMEPGLLKRINSSGKGLVVPWAPQVQVLRHEATGIFLTHCGVGSITEAIVAETPIIAMPFTADQPYLAAYFTQVRKIGIHLYQVSGNPGLMLGNGVHVVSSDEAIRDELVSTWQAMKGQQGEVYRQNVKEMKLLMKQSMEIGGARSAMMAFDQFWREK